MIERRLKLPLEDKSFLGRQKLPWKTKCSGEIVSFAWEDYRDDGKKIHFRA